MDFKVMMATLAAVFLAELADKTQLVGISMAAKSGKPLSVLLGSVLGYIVVTAVSVFLGSVLGHYLKPDYLRIGGSLIFITIGLLMFFNKL